MKFNPPCRNAVDPVVSIEKEAADLKRTLDSERLRYEAEFGRIAESVAPDLSENEDHSTHPGTNPSGRAG